LFRSEIGPWNLHPDLEAWQHFGHKVGMASIQQIYASQGDHGPLFLLFYLKCSGWALTFF